MEEENEVDPIAGVAVRVLALENASQKRVEVSEEAATNIQNMLDAGNYAFAIRKMFEVISA